MCLVAVPPRPTCFSPTKSYSFFWLFTNEDNLFTWGTQQRNACDRSPLVREARIESKISVVLSVAASSIDSKWFPSSPSTWTMLTCSMSVFYIESRDQQCTSHEPADKKRAFALDKRVFETVFVGEGVSPRPNIRSVRRCVTSSSVVFVVVT